MGFSSGEAARDKRETGRGQFGGEGARWGRGEPTISPTTNIANDHAADWLADPTRRLLDEVRDRDLLEWDEIGGVLLADQRWVGVALPRVEEAEGWKTTFMEVWGASIDELRQSESSHRIERRAALVATFDKMIDLARSQ